MPEAYGGLFKLDGDLKALLVLAGDADDTASLALPRAVVLKLECRASGKRLWGNQHRAVVVHFHRMGADGGLLTRRGQMQSDCNAEEYSLAAAPFNAGRELRTLRRSA